jgi:hypothetical protein
VSRASARRTEILGALIPGRPMSDLDGPNARLHWAVRGRRSKFWQDSIHAYLTNAGFPRSLPDNGRGYVVRISVQQARPPLPDTDNRLGMCKQVRDHIAKFLGVSDAPGGIEWSVDWVLDSVDEMRVELHPPAEALPALHSVDSGPLAGQRRVMRGGEPK